MSKYSEIAKILEGRIILGTYPAGTALPEQAALAKEFETSRITIQNALEILRKSGYIYSRQGSGTYVRQNVLSTMSRATRADDYMGSMDSYSTMGTVTTKIIQFDVRFPTENEQYNLMLTPSNPVYDIIRLRILDDRPHVLEYTIMPVDVIPGITEEVLDHSIYSHIKDSLGLKIGGINRAIRAMKPGKLEQEYLLCAPDDPVLDIEQVVYLEDGTPFEFSNSRHHYKVGCIYVSL